MDINSVGAGNKVVSGLSEAGGAIGIICGLLLVCMFLFFRHLMESLKQRDTEMVNMHNQLQAALIENSKAFTALIHILKQRSCLSDAGEALEQISKESKTVYLKKRE